MGVISKEQLLEQVRTRIGDDNSDEALKFIEDITDTINDYETKANGDGVDWKQKYEENDKEWREKYKDRFFNTHSQDDNIDDNAGDDNDENDAPKAFEDLFQTK